MFANDVDIEISQLIDMDNPRKGVNKLRVRIKSPSGEATAQGPYQRMARAADHQLIGQWTCVSNSQGPNYRHALASTASD